MADGPTHRLGQGVNYDLLGVNQFAVLTVKLGMRDWDYLLDIGCGSLRGGRFAITYLAPGHYFGIEPHKDQLEAAKREELGLDFIAKKKPVFSNDDNFTLSAFGRKFDYLMAQSIFSHTSPAQTQRCLQEAAKVMHRGSLFAATYIRGPESYTGTAWSDPGDAYRAEDLFEWVHDAGLRAEPLDWFHPRQKWILITLR